MNPDTPGSSGAPRLTRSEPGGSGKDRLPKLDLKSPPKKSGYVWRGSDVVETVVNRRYAVLYHDVFATYRKDSEKEPSKVWPLHSTCELSSVEPRELLKSREGYNNVVAWMSGKVDKAEGYGFTISWPKSRLMKDTSIVLAFEDEDVAFEWHAAFVTVIACLIPYPGDVSEGTADRETPTPTGPPSNTNSTDFFGIGPGMPSTSDMHNAMRGDFPGPLTVGQNHWRPIKLINGMAVYYEEDESGGAYMVSKIVRAPPRACLDTLLTGSFLLGSMNVNLLRRDGDLEILRLELQPTGLGGWFLAPRELILERSWREEEDGTVVVLFKSCTEEGFPKRKEDDEGWLSWFSKPVLAEIPAAGFTISPLREEFLKLPAAVAESLVTLVFKVDWGGVCSTGSPLKPVMDGLGVCQSWVERVMSTVLVLQESVEHSRFASESCKPMIHEEAQRSDSDVDEQPPVRALDGVLNPRFWEDPGAAGFKVRGATYLKDKKKILTGAPKFDLDWVYLVKLKSPMKDVGKFLPALRTSPDEFTFIVQIMIPGPPHMSLVVGWHRTNGGHEKSSPGRDSSEPEQVDPFDLSLMRFIRGNDETRNSLFKLIPSVLDGSWITRQSVGHTPVIMGRKLKQTYHSGQGYFEVDIDVASSRTASAVVGMVSGATRGLTVDLAILFEGKRDEELPESLLGTVRLDHVDLEAAIPLETIIESRNSGIDLE
ncbi:hypothetical protein BSKO_04430 [Bryopsis sp. KO-2023]|nr:hypothetical protein BSKO_04430 [Bryopsis sp. KO-2023]